MIDGSKMSRMRMATVGLSESFSAGVKLNAKTFPITGLMKTVILTFTTTANTWNVKETNKTLRKSANG